MKNQPDYRWHGEPVKVVFGSCIIQENKEKPLYWYNYECYPDGVACVPCLKVTSEDGYSFLISNHHGIGVNKLLKGGWPDQTHFSLDGGDFSTSPRQKYETFDLDGFEEHERKRREWQKLHFPEEYEKMEAFKNAIKGFV